MQMIFIFLCVLSVPKYLSFAALSAMSARVHVSARLNFFPGYCFPSQWQSSGKGSFRPRFAIRTGITQCPPRISNGDKNRNKRMYRLASGGMLDPFEVFLQRLFGKDGISCWGEDVKFSKMNQRKYFAKEKEKSLMFIYIKE